MSADGGSDTNSGTSPIAPFATIDRALSRTQRRTVIAIAPGLYTESLTLRGGQAGRTLTGGFLADWSRDCSASARSRTVIQGSGVGLEFVSVSGPAITVRQLTVRSGETTMKSGSTYGLRATASNVTLHDVVVIADEAGSGGVPADPAEMTGTTLCFGNVDCSTGANGPRGAPGRPSDGGWFDVTGYLPGHGAVGTSGVPGFNGTVAPIPVPTNCAVGCNMMGVCSNQMTACPVTTMGMSSSGLCGCGGLPGSGGPGGIGGGASIALFAAGGSFIEVTDSRLESGAGGDGAAGADGGAGGRGSLGARGTPLSCVNPIGATCNRSLCIQSCSLNGQMMNVLGGLDGGTGGEGGQGGSGGPGAGGPSIGVVSVSSTVMLSPTTIVRPGPGGQAAPGGVAGFSDAGLTIP